MPILAIMRPNNMTRENYDSLRPVVQWEKDYPNGALLHTCAVDPGGKLHIVDIWESKTLFDDFYKNRLTPQLKKLNLPVPEMDIYEIYNLNAFPGIETHKPGGRTAQQGR